MLVEAAIVLPILIAIILGILYFGRYEEYSNQVTQLAEEGARAAAVDNWPGSTATPQKPLQSFIQGQAQGELQQNNVAPARVYVYVPAADGTYALGHSIRVCVIATGTPPPTGGSAPVLVGAATMRIETIQTGWTSTTTTPFDGGNPAGARPSRCPA